MTIWKQAITLEKIKDRNAGTMIAHVDIEFTEIGDDFLRAKMPVDGRTKQPVGIMHGGASCVLAESVASVAANFCLEGETQHAVGLEITTSHIKMARSGFVTGTAKPVSLGKTIQVWEVRITDDADALVSLTRLTLIVINRR